MHGEASGKPPDQTCWCATVGVVSDYVAVQSKAVMLLSHLDRISPGGNACLCVCRRQSRHGNFDFIKADREGEELAVWRKCTTVFLACTCPPFPHPCWCSLTICLWVCELWKFNETNWWRRIAIRHVFDSLRCRFDESGSFIFKSLLEKVEAGKEKESVDLSARMPSEMIIKELNELQPGKGISRGWGMDMWKWL